MHNVPTMTEFGPSVVVEGPLERRHASLVQSHTFLRNYIPSCET